MMMRSLSLATAMAVLCQSASAFSFRDMERKRVSSALQMSIEPDSRRDFFAKSATTALTAAGLGIGVLAPSPANAANLEKVNARLKG
jgi:hypothetical protein